MTYVYEVRELKYVDDFVERVNKSTFSSNYSSAIGVAIDAASKHCPCEPFQIRDERNTGFGDFLKIYDPKEDEFMKGSWAIFIHRREVK